MDHTVGQRLKQSTISTRPGLSQRVLAPAPLPPTDLRPVSGNLYSHPASANYGVPQDSIHGPLILWIYVDMTLALPCQRHTAKLSTQLWMQNERR